MASKPKGSVWLVLPPTDWQPTRVHSVPPAIVSATLLARGLTTHGAIKAARAFNLAHLQVDEYDGRWAIAAGNLRQQPRRVRKGVAV